MGLLKKVPRPSTFYPLRFSLIIYSEANTILLSLFGEIIKGLENKKDQVERQIKGKTKGQAEDAIRAK